MKNKVKIVKDGDEILRKIAKEVNVDLIGSTKICNVIENMKTALSREKYGVAIAAPQIGVGLRIFVVSEKIFDYNYSKMPDTVFINPIILKTSKKMQNSNESCLSIQGRPVERGPDVAGVVKRPAKMLIEYYDENGNKKQRGASGLLAAIFDHEIDHLNGVLFTDKAEELWEIDEEFNRK